MSPPAPDQRAGTVPVALDPAFLADCPYAPEGLLLDEILEVDRGRSLLVARMATPEDLPLTRHQRTHPIRHPRHLNGGLIVHLTGMVGFAHAHYVLDLRHREGWIGYGARIHRARFGRLAVTGVPLLLRGWATQVRRGPDRIVARYRFEFLQEAELVYEGDQTAMWTRVTAGRAG
jgi:hypothetical protein